MQYITRSHTWHCGKFTHTSGAADCTRVTSDTRTQGATASFSPTEVKRSHGRSGGLDHDRIYSHFPFIGNAKRYLSADVTFGKILDVCGRACGLSGSGGPADGYDKSHGDCLSDLSHRNQPDLSWPLAKGLCNPHGPQSLPQPSSGPRDLWPSPTNTVPLIWTPAHCLHAGRVPHDLITVTGQVSLCHSAMYVTYCFDLRLSRTPLWTRPFVEGLCLSQARAASSSYRLPMSHQSPLLSTAIPLWTPY